MPNEAIARLKVQIRLLEEANKEKESTMEKMMKEKKQTMKEKIKSKDVEIILIKKLHSCRGLMHC